MLLKLIDHRIRAAFSNSAMQYEALAGLQKEIGRELVGKISDREDCRYILDVGMGTGWLTNRLSLLFPEARVFGLDFAGGMIQSARQQYETFQILQADAAALPFQRDVFDIIVSNLTYQWLDDLKATFQQSYSTLKANGIFCLTLFGHKTLEELFLSLGNSSIRNKEGKEKNTLLVKRLPEENDVRGAICKAGFKNIETESEIIKVHFEDMMALVKWIKDIGANAIRKNIYIGKDGLLQASEYYNRNFKDSWGVYASFEVIWVKAIK